MADTPCDAAVNEGPAFELAIQTGTAPCVDLNTTPNAPPTPCMPEACAQFYQLISEGDGTSLAFSAGGPFQLPIPAGPSPYICPPNVQPTVLTNPTDPVNYAKPGILSDVVCIPNMTPGTYHAYTRMEIRDFPPGTHVQVRFLPTCSDISLQYVVLDYYSLCTPYCPPNAPPEFLPLTNGTIEGELVVPISGCDPGFILVVHSGQQQCDLDTGLEPNIRNFQFELERLTARRLIPASPLHIWDGTLAQHNSECECPS